MSTKTPECWANDAQARGVRIEISADHSILLPHDEFVFAELKHEGKEQTLRLFFVTHEVLVRGQSLRRIETAMQRMELSFLAKLPNSQRSFFPEGQPFIGEIVIKETKDVEKAGISHDMNDQTQMENPSIAKLLTDRYACRSMGDFALCSEQEAETGPK